MPTQAAHAVVEEQQSTGARRPHPKRKRILVALAVAFLLLLALAWFERASIVGRLARSYARRAASIELDWRSFEFEGLSRITISGLRVRGLDSASPIHSLAIDRIELDFEARALLFDGVAGITSVHASGVRAVLARPVRHGGSDTGTGSGTFTLPARLPVVVVDALDIAFAIDPTRSVAALGGRVRVSNDPLTVELQFESFAWRDGASTREHPLDLRVSSRGSRVTVERATWDPSIALESASVELPTVAKRATDIDVTFSAFHGSISASARIADGSAKTTFDLRGVELSSALATLAPRVTIELAARLDATGTLDVPLSSPLHARGSARVDANDVDVLGRRAESVSGRVDLVAGGIELADVLVAQGANAGAVHAGFVPLPWDPCSSLLSLRASLDAQIDDPGALWQANMGPRSSVLSNAGDPALALLSVGPFTLAGLVQGGEATAEFRAENAAVARILRAFRVDLAEADTLVLDAGAKITIPFLDPKSTHGRLTFDAREARIAGHSFEVARGALALRADELTLDDVLIASAGNVVSIPQARVEKPFDACVILERTVAAVDLDLEDIPVLLDASALPVALPDLPAHRLLVSGTIADGNLSISRGLFEAPGNAVVIQPSRVPLRGGARAILHDPGLDLDLSVALQDLRGLAELVPDSIFSAAQPTAGRVAGLVRIRGDPARPRGELALRATGVRFPDFVIDEMLLRADLDDQALRIERVEARTSVGEILAEGSWFFDDKRVEAARVDVDIDDAARLSSGLFRIGALHVEGRAEGPLASLDGTLRIDASDVTLANTVVSGFEMVARAEAGRIFVENFAAATPDASVRASGHIEGALSTIAPMTMAIDQLDLEVEGDRFALARSARIHFGRRDFDIATLHLAGTSGEVVLDASVDRERGCVDLAARGILLSAVASKLWPWMPNDARVDADFSGEWGHGDVHLSTRGSATGSLIRPGTQAEPSAHASARWDLALENRRARITELDVSVESATSAPSRASLRGQFPLDVLGPALLGAGSVDLRATLDVGELNALTYLPAATSGAFSSEVVLSGSWSDVTGTASVDGERLAWKSGPDREAVGPMAVHARMKFDRTVDLLSATFDLPFGARLESKGSIGAPLDLTTLVGDGPAPFLDAPLSFQASLGEVDLAFLAERISALRRTGGKLTGRVDVGGTLSRPTIDGNATLTEGEVRLTSNLPAIAGVAGTLHFDGDVVRIEGMHGELGGAPFLARGTCTIPEMVLDLAVEGDSLLVYRESDVRVRADAKLNLRGPLEALELSGDLVLRDSRYSKKLDFLALPRRSRAAPTRGLHLFSLREPPFDALRFDVRVTSGTPFEIRNNVARGELRPDLVLAGTGQLPVLRGTVQLGRTRVLVPSGSLQVRSGRIEFRADRPDVPVLDIEAQTRLQGYDIQIHVSGPYDEPRIDLTSIPPLTREELVLLVITGRPPGSGLSLGTGERAAIDVAVYIARDVAAEWLAGDEDSAESLAERLEVVVGSDRTRSGADAVLVRMRLAGDPSLHGDAVYLTGERDIYDFYNFGVRFVLTFR